MSEDNNSETVADESSEQESLEDAISALYDENPDENQEENQQESSESSDLEAESEPDNEKNDSDNVSEDDSTDEDGEDGEVTFPEHMPKELQEALKPLGEAAKKAGVDVFQKMQTSFSKKNQEFAEQKRFAEDITIALDSRGYTSASQQESAIANYIKFDDLVSADPKAAITKLMNHANLKPEDFGVGGDDHLTEDEILTNNKIDALEQKIKSLELTTSQSRKEKQVQIVNDFREKRDSSGELENPHFDLVKEDMMSLADANPNLTIEQLYNKAVRMNDELYEKTLASREKKIAEKIEAKRKSEVQKAKKQNRQSSKPESHDTKIVDEDAQYEAAAIAAGFS
jgi:hypothetical protein